MTRMVRARHAIPVGHGEVLAEPPYELWAERAEANAAAVSDWGFTIGGMSGLALRRLARRETVAEAGAYSRRIGIDVATVPVEPRLLLVTGHQPDFYHPGVWVKDFLLQRLADETGAAALDLVVDTDSFERVELRTPCTRPSVGRCTAVLGTTGVGGCFACAPVPTCSDVEMFRQAGLDALSTLPAPALGKHFDTFCDVLLDAIGHADDLGQALTGARRRFESPAKTDYLELGVSRQARTSAFRRFAAALLLDAEGFATVFNAELRAYRTRTGTRSKVQPFPDLSIDERSIELPFWVLSGGRRRPARVTRGDAPALLADDGSVCDVPSDVDDVMSVLEKADALLVPRAATLTLFNRMFVADLFIHGVGGGRYDRVTDAVARSYFGVEPPTFVVASMTLHLPLGEHVVTDEEIVALEQRLQRLEHNPDQLLDEVEFDDAGERLEAERLVAEKCALVTEIAEKDVDKKTVGERIRAVNARLSRIMAPVVAETAERLEAVRAQRETAEILSDRTYPYCLWNPIEVMDKVR
ncbi:MAG: hypothetical protein Q7J82_01265 [Coriobacteriia bacterium]|nr:hypothetical protein [Coriobacteriia bacterium]